MNNVEEVKARIDIVDLVSETVQLRRAGKNYSGFCPFHDNKRTPAFAVFPDSGTWRCFGQCNEGGDIFKYVMKKEGWDFAETLNYLAAKAGVELTPLTPVDKEKEETYDRLRAILEDAVKFYQHQLLQTPAGKQALEYLTKRSLDIKSIETWELGYAPQSWNMTRDYLLNKGYSEDELLEAGIVSKRDSGGTYDRYRHRVMFPIREERGRIAGFGARILNPDDVPKFLNSPQTPLFDKSHLLYGFDKAKRSIRTEDQAIIVEGYLDVIAAHQYGFTNVVSPMGTALTEHQLRMLKRQTHRIILALDADAAGDKATLRGLEIARQTMDREGEVRFDARGLLNIEGRLQADIRVCSLPEGLDPDDVLHEDPAAFTKILEDARPIVIHVMETLAKNENLDDPKTKSRIASEVLPLIEDVANPVERETYRQRLARLLQVDERALLQATVSKRTRSRRYSQNQPTAAPPAVVTKQTSQETVSHQEEHILGLLLRKPELTFRLDRALKNSKLAPLSTVDFQDTDHQLIIKIIQNAANQDFSIPASVAISSLPLPLMGLGDRLLEKSKDVDSSDDKLLEILFLSILRLRSINLHKSLNHIKFIIQESSDAVQNQDVEYNQTILNLSREKMLIDQASNQSKLRALLTE